MKKFNHSIVSFCLISSGDVNTLRYLLENKADVHAKCDGKKNARKFYLNIITFNKQKYNSSNFAVHWNVLRGECNHSNSNPPILLLYFDSLGKEETELFLSNINAQNILLNQNQIDTYSFMNVNFFTRIWRIYLFLMSKLKEYIYLLAHFLKNEQNRAVNLFRMTVDSSMKVN